MKFIVECIMRDTIKDDEEMEFENVEVEADNSFIAEAMVREARPDLMVIDVHYVGE